ncbi:MAG TPA: selenocysteine-specific translation elongation factor [Candidatus Krumholzibacteria bacterium]|nr:selenocysteine-specific translation elongation factor [Candidatus Krumholzibacteria bacterium]
MTPGREEAGAPAARHFILGTAGHVDHGKTELVRALTGHDTDRLKEEKERGISIELGFAPLELAPGVFIGIIDVPGHERFVRQMVAGAGGIDMAMLLVAADEGVMPQTVEHVEVLRSLGIHHGVVVISKSDLASDETLDLVREEIAELVRGTFLENATVIPVSARTGNGLDALRAELLAMARRIDVRAIDGPFRLAVDRVFHQKGIGVVITGSCYSGRVRVGDEIEFLPAGVRVRVREIQSFGARRGEGVAGERLALALHGVKLEDIQRGDTLATPGYFAVTDTIDVRVVLTETDDAELVNRERVRIHHGSSEVLGRVLLFEHDLLQRGASALAQLRLESRLVCDAGDRLVLRTYSPARVIGGATVLNPRARAHRRSDASALESLRLREQGDPVDVIEKTVERAGIQGLPEAEADSALIAQLHARGDVISISGRIYHRRVFLALGARAVELANAHIAAHPLQWGMDKEELRRRLAFPHSAPVFNRVIEKVAETSPLFVRESRVRAGSREMVLPPELARVMEELVERIRAAGVAFPTRDELAVQWTSREPFADAATVLRDHPDVVELADGWMHREAMERSLAALGTLFASRGEVAVGDLKDALGITRKHAIPLLEYFDSHGITVRRGNARVAGPGLPDAKKLVEKPKLGLPDSR